MIFVTVGTQLPFDRLVMAVDAWAAQNPSTETLAQIGAGANPQHMAAQAALNPDAFDAACANAKLIIAHAGTGSVLKAMAHTKPILIMPREAARGEHRNDHQIATAKHFATRPGVHVVRNAEDIAPTIDALLASAEPGQNPTHADDSLIQAIRAVIFP